MTNLGFSINPEDPELIEREAKPLPVGTYEVYVVNTSLADTRKGGKSLRIELMVAGGDYDGRKLNDFLNVVNANKGTQAGAHARLASYAKAVKHVGLFSNTAVLLGKKICVEVGEEKRDDGKIFNKITKVVTNASPSVEPASAQAQGDVPPPWDDNDVPF